MKSMMTGEDIKAARVTLGAMWKAGGGPLTAQELVRALGLSEKNGTDHVYKMEAGRSTVSGTIEMLLRVYLECRALPPDDVLIFGPAEQRKKAR